MSTSRSTGRRRSEWSASNRPIAPVIGPPLLILYVHLYVCDIGNRLSAAFSRSNCETEPSCTARREIPAQPRMMPIFDSLWPVELQKAAYTREFRGLLRRMRNIEDCLAERGGFEPSRPFISRMFARFHAHFLSPDRNPRGQNGIDRIPSGLSRPQAACDAQRKPAPKPRPNLISSTLRGCTGFVQPCPRRSPKRKGGRALFEPGPSSHVVAKLLLDLRLPRPCRRPIAFTETLAASAVPPLDETRSQVVAPAIAANQLV